MWISWLFLEGMKSLQGVRRGCLLHCILEGNLKTMWGKRYVNIFQTLLITCSQFLLFDGMLLHFDSVFKVEFLLEWSIRSTEFLTYFLKDEIFLFSSSVRNVSQTHIYILYILHELVEPTCWWEVIDQSLKFKLYDREICSTIVSANCIPKSNVGNIRVLLSLAKLIIYVSFSQNCI